MSTGQIIWFAATGALFVPWAVLAFATLYRLSRVAAGRRAEVSAGIWQSYKIAFRTYFDFLSGRLYPRNRLWLALIAIALFALIAARPQFYQG